MMIDLQADCYYYTRCGQEVYVVGQDPSMNFDQDCWIVIGYGPTYIQGHINIERYFNNGKFHGRDDQTESPQDIVEVSS